MWLDDRRAAEVRCSEGREEVVPYHVNTGKSIQERARNEKRLAD